MIFFLHVGWFNKESGRKILHTINKYIYNNNTNHYNMLCTFLIPLCAIVRNWELWWRFRTSASTSYSLCKFASTVKPSLIRRKRRVLFYLKCAYVTALYIWYYLKNEFGYSGIPENKYSYLKPDLYYYRVNLLPECSYPLPVLPDPFYPNSERVGWVERVSGFFSTWLVGNSNILPFDTKACTKVLLTMYKSM